MEIEGAFGYTTLPFPYFWGHQNFKKHTYQEARVMVGRVALVDL